MKISASAAAAAVILALLAVFAAFFGGAQYGTARSDAAHLLEKNQLVEDQRIALLTEIDKRAADQTTNERKAREATATHEKAITDLAARYERQRAADRLAGGLRIPANVCARPAAAGIEAAGTGRPDEGAAATVELPERTQERLYALTFRADSLAEQLRALQGWVVGNGFYGEPHGQRIAPGSAPAVEEGRDAATVDQR